MRALTVLQPWAWAILHAGKTVENRTWPTAYRGPLLIHAGKSRRLVGCDMPPAVDPPDPAELVFGAILGLVDLVDCVPVEKRPDDVWACGPWCFVLANPLPIKPVACAGALNLWEPPAGELKAVRAGIELAAD